MSTKATIAAAGAAGEGRKAPQRVGISISNADATSLVPRGLSEAHLDDLFLELCGHLLSAGHHLAYGGDPLSKKNFTTALRDIGLAHRYAEPDGPRRMTNYVARHLAAAPAFRRAELREAMDIEVVDRDVAPDEPDVIQVVLDLTAMRRRMTAAIDVRVVVGGDPTPGPRGTRRGSGVLEEAYLALRAGVPVLVSGGFGGAASVIADALRGNLDPAVVDRMAAHFDPVGPLLEATPEPVTFREMLAAFSPSTDLDNRLTADENIELLTTDEIDTVVALVLTAVQRGANRA